MQIPYIRNTVEGKSQITLFLGGVPTPVDETHPAFNEISERLSTLTPQEVRELLDSGKRVRRVLAQFGNVTVDGDTVFYKGEAVHGLLANRMLKMLEDGQDIRPWALFLENLQQNPAKHAVDELYGWLEHANMPITERGNFLAYKKVKEDYTSYHRNPDGTDFRNDIGTFVSMPRNKVDDNRNRTCSSGLHFCSWDYLGSYMGHTGKVVILEINPAHVVSIPTDYNNAKGRAEGYLIVGEIPQEQCQHAFPGLSYVGYGDSPYITYRQEGEIDYSEIEEGWYSDYACVDEDEFEEACQYAYSRGFNCGYEDGFSDEFFDPDLYDDEDFETDEEWEHFIDGYRDGYYSGQEDLFKDNEEEEEDEEVLESEEITDDDFENILRAIGFIVLGEKELNEIAAVSEEVKKLPQSTKEEFSVASLVDDINSGRLTLKEVLKEWDLFSFEVADIINQID